MEEVVPSSAKAMFLGMILLEAVQWGCEKVVISCSNGKYCGIYCGIYSIFQDIDGY